jgi:hypothetical protein
MENKYYTPKIEEFHVGFECEWQSKIRKETWNNQVCDTDLISIAYDEFEHADEEEPFKDQFRVKYLDKEDIESLGWVRRNDKIKAICKNEFNFNRLIMSFLSNGLVIIRRPNDKNLSAYGNLPQLHTIFSGFLKNKSEFKRVMEQLGIAK